MKATFELALLLSCFTLVLMSQEEIEFGKLVLECMTENGVTMQDVEDLKSGKVKPEAAKDNMKCATQCIFVKKGFMDDEGVLKGDAMIEAFNSSPIKDKVAAGVAACSGIVGANPCESAFLTMGCFEEHADLIP